MPERRPDDLDLYIPVVDGAIGYDCQSCGAGCCKVGNIGVLDRERDFLLERWPSLALFQSLRGPNQTTYAKSSPRCWFLQDDLRCGVEEEHGRQSKPHVCRSHPVYLQPYLDERIVVASVSIGCVWATGDLSRAIGTLKWDDVRALHDESLRAGLYRTGPRETSSFAALGGLARPLLEAEARIRDETAAHRTADSHLAWQVAYANKQPAIMEPAIDVSQREVRTARKEVRLLQRLATRFLGLDATQLPKKPAFPFELFVPLLRLQIVRSLLEALGATKGGGVSREGLGQVFRAIPKVLVVLALYTKAYGTIGSDAGGPDFDTASGLLARLPERLMGLSNFGRSPEELPSIDSRGFPSRLDDRLTAMRALAAGGHHETLGDLLEEVCGEDSVSERLDFLDALTGPRAT